jgi:hypothetical protein
MERRISVVAKEFFDLSKFCIGIAFAGNTPRHTQSNYISGGLTWLGAILLAYKVEYWELVEQDTPSLFLLGEFLDLFAKILDRKTFA